MTAGLAQTAARGEYSPRAAVVCERLAVGSKVCGEHDPLIAAYGPQLRTGGAMLEWFRRRGQRPKRLAEMTPDELDAMLADHPQLETLLGSTIGVMQFAPPKVAESVLQRVEEIIDETLRRRLSPEAEQDFVLRELETVRRMLAGEGSE